MATTTDRNLERRQQLERVLALGRLSLAALLPLVLRLEGVTAHQLSVLGTFVGVYAGYAWVAAVLAALPAPRLLRLGGVLHWIDVGWVLAVTALTEGPNNIFLVFYIFVLVGAAFRWGLKQTAATGFITAAALVAEAALWQSSGIALPGPDPTQIVTRSTYAVALGLLVGYLAEEQHATRNFLAASARVLAAVHAQNGLRASIEAALGEMLATFGARSAALEVTERATGAFYRWVLPGADRPLAVTTGAPPAGQSPRAGDKPRSPVYTVRRVVSRLVIEDLRGRRTLAPDAPAADLLPDDASFVLVGDTTFSDGSTGRILMVEPRAEPGARGRRWLATLLPQAAVSLYSVYLLGRLRSQATAMERARLARELHDGVVQSLVGLEMHVDVLRRRLEASDAAAASELGEIQERLREEARNARELMNDIRPVSGSGEDVPGLLAEIADRFQRDSGIDARFLCSITSVPLAPARVRELVRITQEALVNIRKHSGARTVVLRLAVDGHTTVLTIDDDGKGFEFSGRYTLDDLDRERRGPLVIKERVRQVGGTMVLDSAPGRGSRLEITIPRSAA
jgi:signal transduction histidine kinase